VSRAISQRCQHTALGDHLPFGKGDWSVVGMFEAGNTAFDSEIWVDVNQLASDYNRTTYSSALLRAADPQSIDDLISRIEADRRYDLTAQRELAYYEEQTASAGPIKALGYFIAIVMGIGACFAAMNTMYAAVSYRSREIATLLILGYRRYAILFSFMVEALILSVSGGIIGCLLSLPVNGITTGTANWQTFSEVAFAFQVTPQLLIGGIIFSLLMGLLGGFFPASRASRQKPAFTMREA
jgi:putative ABC transport system permease protein